LNRVITDHLTRSVKRVVGTATWGDRADGPPSSLQYHEIGQLTLSDDAPPVSVHASYVWNFDDTLPWSAEVYFPDGRLFHPLTLSEPAVPGGERAGHAFHPCAPDEYTGVYGLSAGAGDARELWWEWEVKGPTKNYKSSTTLTWRGCNA
jgi:hypothetical protein